MTFKLERRFAENRSGDKELHRKYKDNNVIFGPYKRRGNCHIGNRQDELQPTAKQLIPIDEEV